MLQKGTKTLQPGRFADGNVPWNAKSNLPAVSEAEDDTGFHTSGTVKDEDRRTVQDVKGPTSTAVHVGHRYSLRSITTIKDEHAVLNGKRLVDSDEMMRMLNTANQEHLMMSSACGKPLMSASQKK